MKKVILIAVLALVAYAAYKLLYKGDDESRDPKPSALKMGATTGSFRESVDTLMASYFELKDALVESDTMRANRAALRLAIASDSLKTDEISGDSTGVIKETAKNFAGTINGSAKALSLEKSIDAKRMEFEMISDALWSLARTIKYDGQKVYYQFCPMAFDNRGAYWLSSDPAIKNPYFGKKMLTCGSNRDSISYAAN